MFPAFNTQPLSILVRISLLLAVLAAGACGDGTVGERAEIVDPEQYLDELPAYPEAPEPYDRAIEGATFDGGDPIGDGPTMVCSTTTYEIGDAPEQVVMFNTDPQVMWPGALIQGDSYEDGSPMLIPLPGRAPLDLSIEGLYAKQSSAQGVTPTQSAVTEAVNSLLAEAVEDERPSVQRAFFNQKEAYSFEQAALKLGFSARYLGARVKGALRANTTRTENTIMANATIRTFTVSVDQPPTPSSFFEGLSQDELQEQIDLGRMSDANLPVYVASVTYGQIMMFSATSSSSMSQLKGALSASFNSFAGGGSVGMQQEQKDLLRDSEITVVTLGGSEQGVAGLIADGEPARFFEGSTVVTSSVPIAYTLKDLRGNIVKVAESTKYPLTTCAPAGTANIYAVGDDMSEVLGYYADGSEALLDTAIPVGDSSEVMDSYERFLDIAYDDFDETLLALQRVEFAFGGTTTAVQRFAPNGMRLDAFAVGTRASALTYDRMRARIYVVGDFEDGHVLEAYNANGEYAFSSDTSIEGATLPRAVTHDPVHERIYVATEVLGGASGRVSGTVVVFDFQGREQEVLGDFDGLRDPQGIAHDPKTGRIFVSDRFDDTVKVYDEEGRKVDQIDELREPRGLLFEETSNRLYVTNHASGVITAYEPDGTPALGLAVPAFPNLTRPTALAFRPF